MIVQMPVEYKLLTAALVEDLEKFVNDLIKTKVWVPLGSPFVDKNRHVYQAMVKQGFANVDVGGKVLVPGK